MMTHWMSRLQWFLLFIILAAGIALRFSHADWDGGNQLHPDERAILFVASQIEAPPTLGAAFHPLLSPLNPFRASTGEARQYPYGHLPLYAEVALQRILAYSCQEFDSLCQSLEPNSFLGRLLNSGGGSRFQHLTYIGRALSALFDSLTIVATFLLARQMFAEMSGLIGASMLSQAVLHIQNAHFGTVDTALSLFVTLAVWQMVRYVETQSRRASILSGVLIGLAVGCKATAVLLLIPFMILHIRRRPRSPVSIPVPRLRDFETFWLSLLAAFVSFAVTNPYAVLDPVPYLTSVITQAQVTSGGVDWPFTRQYIGTLPIIYPIEQQARWLLGLPLTITMYAGLAYFTFRAWMNPRHPFAVPVIWAWCVLLTVGVQQVKFPRYFLPATPAMFAIGAGMITALGEHSRPQRMLRAGLLILLLLPTVLYAAAFVNMYRSPHPWVAASEWVYSELPSGTVIISEQWDDPLPLEMRMNGQDHLREAAVDSRLIDPFAQPDDVAKMDAITEQLAAADYVILSSSRLYGVIPRHPERYPLTSSYYRVLFSGELGYQFDRSFARFPNLFGVSLIDDPLAWPDLPNPGIEWPVPALRFGPSDESFTVYDRPLVLVFRNEARLSAAEIRAQILNNRSADSSGD